jgi:hypothetical protein
MESLPFLALRRRTRGCGARERINKYLPCMNYIILRDKSNAIVALKKISSFSIDVFGV